MPLTVNRREVEDIVILDLAGRLVLGPEASELRRAFEQLKLEKKNRIALNLKDVEYIDSTGLGTLVVGHSSAKQSGGAMKLIHVSKRITGLLILTKLSTVFEIFENERSAIDSFFPGREIKHFDILEFVKRDTAEG